MLNVMRDTLKYSKWILMLVVISFVLFFGVDWWGRREGRAGGGEDWVAKVNGKAIDPNEWNRLARQIDERYRQMFRGQYDKMRDKINPARQAAEQLITQELVLTDAARLGIKVSDRELSDFITSYPPFLQNGQFIGRQAYERILREGNFSSAADFEVTMRKNLVLDRYKDLIEAAVRVDPKDVEKEFRRRNENASFEYLALPLDRANTTAPSDAELESYYKAHIDQFGRGEGRRLFFILFDETAVGSRVAVADKEIEDYYSAHRSEFENPEQRQVRHILIKVDQNAPESAIEAAKNKAQDLATKIRGGADFAQLAQQFSDDPGSKARGGDLGFFPRGQMVPQFDDAAFTMQQGVVSDPVRTDFGFHVIRVEKITPPGIAPLASVKEQIKAQIRMPRLRDEGQKLAQEFKGKVKDIDSFKKTAEEMKLLVRDAGVVLENDIVPGLGPVPALLTPVFQVAKGGVTDVVELPRGFVIGAVQEILPNHVPPFAARREQVGRQYRAEHAKQQGKAMLESALAKAGGDLAKAAKDLKIEVQKTQAPFTRGGFLQGVGGGPELDQAAFATPLASNSPVIATEQAAAVLHLQSRQQPDLSLLAKQEAQITAQLKQPLTEQIFREKIEALRHLAKTEYNEKVLKP